MENKPTEILFSIVIPTYNHAHLIGKCLNSLINQTYKNWEAVVVNNFSNDNTIEVINSFNDNRIKLVNFRNSGIIAASRNEGIRNTTGQWICFLDSDDWWTSDKLETCLPYLNDYDLLHHDLYIQYEGKKKWHRSLTSRSLSRQKPFEDLLLNGNACNNSSVVIRREIIDLVGYISEDKTIVAAEDFDYWLRVSKVTTRIKHIPRKLGYYWKGNTGISANEKTIAAIDAVYAKHFESINSESLKTEILRHSSYRQARICHKLGFYEQAKTRYRIALRSRHLLTLVRAMIMLGVLGIGVKLTH